MPREGENWDTKEVLTNEHYKSDERWFAKDAMTYDLADISIPHALYSQVGIIVSKEIFASKPIIRVFFRAEE